MTKQEFLAMSFPYGLKFEILDGITNQKTGIYKLSAVFETGVVNGFNYDNHVTTDKHIPIIRHLDSLTKKCIQADYNDGKPFIPIVELVILSDRDSDHAFLIAWEDRKYDSSLIECMPFWMAQMLLKWHFSLITEDCEKVYVTNDFNPYK